MKDCCSHDKDHKHKSNHKSEEPNWKNIITWGAIGVLLVVVLYTVLGQGSTAQVAIPAAEAGAKAASSYGGMVGGC